MLSYPQPPELGLNARVGVEGDFNRGAIALAGDALGFDPRVQVACGFDGYGRSLRGADFEGQ